MAAQHTEIARLVERARDGHPRAVARLITLVENASPLLREVMAAVEEGAARGVTTWLAAGTGRRSHLGAPTLLAHPDVQALDVLDPAPPIHYTEDPTDAPRGVADVVLAVLHDAEPALRPTTREDHA